MASISRLKASLEIRKHKPLLAILKPFQEGTIYVGDQVYFIVNAKICGEGQGCPAPEIQIREVGITLSVKNPDGQEVKRISKSTTQISNNQDVKISTADNKVKVDKAGEWRVEVVDAYVVTADGTKLGVGLTGNTSATFRVEQPQEQPPPGEEQPQPQPQPSEQQQQQGFLSQTIELFGVRIPLWLLLLLLLLFVLLLSRGGGR